MLLFDEASSALDAETEALLHEWGTLDDCGEGHGGYCALSVHHSAQLSVLHKLWWVPFSTTMRRGERNPPIAYEAWRIPLTSEVYVNREGGRSYCDVSVGGSRPCYHVLKRGSPKDAQDVFGSLFREICSNIECHALLDM